MEMGMEMEWSIDLQSSDPRKLVLVLLSHDHGHDHPNPKYSTIIFEENG